MHVFAFHFEGEEEVFVRGVRVNAELSEIPVKTFAGAANVTGVREGVFCLGEEGLDFVTGQFRHESIVRPNSLEYDFIAISLVR